MKHITSRLLALLLTVAMIISMMPAVYAADSDVTIVDSEPTVGEPVEDSNEDSTEEVETYSTNAVAVIGEAEYSSLADAIDAAATGGATIVLLKDGALTSDLTKSVTIVGQETGGVKPTITGKYWF